MGEEQAASDVHSTVPLKHVSTVLTDGEIIKQIKGTNHVLAEIKELLKQQVSRRLQKLRWGGSACYRGNMYCLVCTIVLIELTKHPVVFLQIKEIIFLKNTVMECESCGKVPFLTLSLIPESRPGTRLGP